MARPLAGYALSLAAVALVTALLLNIQAALIAATGEYVRPYGIAFLLPVALVTLLWGARQGGFALLLSLLAALYFLMPPRSSLALSYPRRDAVELVALALAGGVVTLCLEAMRSARERAEALLLQVQAAEAALAAAYEKEHHIAESLQRTFLLMPPEEAFPGLTMATLYEAAWDEASVGGDFFDVFALDENRRVALVVGDASGKGLAAATRTAEVKYALRAFLREYPDTGRCVSRLNGHLCDSLRLDWQGGFAFTALCLAVVDQKRGDVSLSIAGGESPVIVRADGTVEVVEAEFNGLPLGVDEKHEYATVTFSLGSGDTLLLLTDGITEARRDRSADFFGQERLLPLARGAAGGALRPTGRAIVEAAREFAGGTLRDDVCLLLARIKGGEGFPPAADGRS